MFERFSRLDGRQGLGQRARPRDRPGAGRVDGRPDRVRLAERLDALHARPCARTVSRENVPRENAATVTSVRAGRVAAIALVAAILGGGGRARGREARPAGCTAGARRRSSSASPPRARATPRRSSPPDRCSATASSRRRSTARRSRGVVTVVSYFASPQGSAGQGSGFVASADGIVLTSAHVITNAGQGQSGTTAPAQRVYVEFSDGDRVQATVVGYDLYDDVGVLKVDPAAHAVSPIPLGDSSRVVVGQPVAAIGSPFGNVDSLSVGVVSAIRRSIPSLTSRYNLVDAIQTDAPINHGNSGGPLFDARGPRDRDQRPDPLQRHRLRLRGRRLCGADRLGQALAAAAARDREGRVRLRRDHDREPDAVDRACLRLRGAPRRARSTSSIPAARAPRPACTGATGRVFRGVDVRLGGDAIVAIDGIPVRQAEDVVRIVTQRLLPGERASFTVVRGTHQARRPVTLSERPAG